MKNPDYDEEPEHILKKVGLKFRLPAKRETTELPVHKREAGVMYCNNVGYAPDFSIKDDINRICRGRDGW